MKTFKEYIEDREFNQFCESINEDFASNVLDKVGDLTQLFRKGCQNFKKDKIAKDPKELAAIFKKNQKVMDDAKNFDDGGTTLDAIKVIDTIVDDTQDIPILSKKQKELKKKVESLKNDTKLQKAMKIIFTDKYIKNKSIEDRLAYAWIILAGRINFPNKKMNVKAGIPIKSS